MVYTMADDPDGNHYIYFVILAVLCILCIIYAACTSYFDNLNENKLRKEADGGNKNAKKIVFLLSNHCAVTTQFGMIFWALCSVSASTIYFAPLLQIHWKLSGQWGALLSGITVILTSVLCLFVFLDFIPKKAVAQKAQDFTFVCAPFLCFWYYIMRPGLNLLHFISDSILRVFGFDPKNIAENVTEEELMMLARESEERGVIQETEKDMIENILDFNDITASELMTHRTDICAAEDTLSIEEALALAVADGRSRIPVFHGDIDSIVGILYVKDLLSYIGQPVPPSLTLTDVIRTPYFIPESKKCSQLFSELTAKKIHIAVIVDEYGGTSGLVTIEDLIESIVGNIQDEYDNEEEDIFKVNEHEFTVDGTTSIDEVSDLVGFDLPEGDYDTIAGFVTERLGKILREDEHPTLEAEGLEISVLEVEDQRISKLLIKTLSPEE
ncbi:MAG: hemolysin family protein [Oscillospiraceae bacterium]